MQSGNSELTEKRYWRRRWHACAVALLIFVTYAHVARAQSSPADVRSDAALAELGAEAKPAVAAGAEQQLSMPLLELTLRGGFLMIPIGILSVIVVAIGVERAIGLRRRRTLPPKLVAGLTEMADRDELDMRRAGQLCDGNPSCLSRVVRAMLSKVGRAQSEVEHAVGEACQRESDRLYANVRTLNLATSVAPLLGLLGTVSGMIQAFFMTAHLPVNVNRSEALAEGIYIALVTTFAGLSVAIPAAVLVHLFESRILRLLGEVEQLAEQLLPLVERLQGARRGGEPVLAHQNPAIVRPAIRRDAKAS
jgi:biopolymer transport protein ExbB